MRWLSLLCAVGLPFGALAAKSAPSFEKFHKQSLSSTPIKLDESSYKKLTSNTRDYSAAILLTAMDARFGCQLCHEFDPEWDVLANSWIQGDKNGESGLVLGRLDFLDGRDVFMSLGLQTAPVLLFFPPTTGDHAAASAQPVRYDFSSGPQSAEQIHSWIARQLPDRPHPAIYRPINYAAWAFTILAGLTSVGVLIKAGPYILPFVQNRNAWAAISLIGILMFTSGHMFNQIRKVPYVAGDGKGGISYFAAGFQSQFGMETQVIAFLYGVMAFATISLAITAPRITNPKTQQIVVISGGVILLGAYSFMLSIFRLKNAGYPFKLPPFV